MVDKMMSKRLTRRAYFVALVCILFCATCAAQQQGSKCPAEEKCCFADLPTLPPGQALVGLYLSFLTPSWYSDCFHSVKTFAENADLTVEIIERSVAEMYSYTDLVRDTSTTDSVVADAYRDRVSVHPLKVDLVEEVKRVHRESVINTTSSGGDSSHYDSYDFHYGLQDAFKLLGDAHTVYLPPFGGDFRLARMAFPWPDVDDEGNMIWKLRKSSPDGNHLNHPNFDGVYEAFHNSSLANVTAYEGRRIRSVNGVPVDAFMRQMADTVGNYKSPGQRLNSLLRELSSGVLNLASFSLPGYEQETYVLEPDGETVSWKLSIFQQSLLDEQNTTSAILEDRINDASGYLTLLEQFDSINATSAELVEPDTVNTDDGNGTVSPLNRRLSALGRLSASIKDHYTEDGRKHYDRLFQQYAEQSDRLLQQAPTPGSAFLPNFEVIRNAWDINSNYYAASYQSDDVIVFKLNTFMPFGVGVQEFFEETTKVFLAGVKRGIEVGTEKLMLDVSGNGGGFVFMIHYLSRLLNNDWTTTESRCNDLLDFREAPLWDAFHDNYSKGWATDALAQLNTEPDEQVSRIGLNVLEIIELLNELQDDLLNPAFPNIAEQSSIDKWRSEFEQCELSVPDCDLGSTRTYLEDIIANVTTNLVLGGASGDNIEPITTNSFATSLAPSDGEPFSPKASLYSGGSVHMRGGIEGKYTAKYFSQLCLPVNADLDELGLPASKGEPLHNFTRIVLLTDGTCGSACSQFATRLMLADMVRTVSYGGFTGEDMDTSAFAGGNVEQFDAFWKETWFTFIAASLFFNGTAEMIDINQLPIPLPSKATVSFNFNEAYANALGPESLPREFYNIPADVNLPMWAANPERCPVFADPNVELLKIWERAKLELDSSPLFIQKATVNNSTNMPETKDPQSTVGSEVPTFEPPTSEPPTSEPTPGRLTSGSSASFLLNPYLCMSLLLLFGGYFGL